MLRYLVVLLFSAKPALALIAPVQTHELPQASYRSESVFIGGMAKDERSLMAVDLVTSAKSPTERLVLTFAEKDGERIKGPMPYFQVSILPFPSRLSVDLAKVERTQVELADIARTLQKSRLIKKVDFTMDPQDGSTNLTLLFYHPVGARVFQKVKNGRLAIDLQKVKGPL